jgi:hypothetical protein
MSRQTIEAKTKMVDEPTGSPAAIVFEYVGPTGLTVIGAVTGKRYRFNRTGTTAAVDARDASWLVTVPNLRLHLGKIKAPP